MHVVYSAAARRDMVGIARAIARDNPSRAAGFVEELASACEGLDDRPERFAVVPGYEAKGYRRRPYGSYSIIYYVGANSVNVYRVLHGARNLHKVLGD
jgi:toxin ParE1/3/4